MDGNGNGERETRKPVTQEDIAQALGLHRRTVSLALNYDPVVSPSTARRVWDKARELGYSKIVDKEPSRSIGVIVPYLGPPAYSEVLRYLREVLVANEYLPVIAISGGVARDEQHTIKELREMDMAGFVLLSSRMRRETIEKESSPRLPIVSIGGQSSQSTQGGFRSVGSDNRLGACKIVEYLVSLGHQHIAYLEGPRLAQSNQDRLQGYRDALKGAGIEADEALIVPAQFGPVATFQWPTLENGYRQFKELLRRKAPVDAVFAYNDEMAIGVLRALRENPRGMPGVSVVGYDNAPIGEYSNPQLTSVGPPWDRVAIDAAELLLTMLGERADASDGKSHILIEPQLVIRESARPPSQNGAARPRNN